MVLLQAACLVLDAMCTRHIAMQSFLLHVHDAHIVRLLERVGAAEAQIFHLGSALSCRRARLRLHHLITRLHCTAGDIVAHADGSSLRNETYAVSLAR